MADNGNAQPPGGRRSTQPERLLAEQAFSRTAGAPLSGGNALRLLRDATLNYPAWLAAIRNARDSIHFENYIIQEDAIGREFIAALAERARAGVKVRLLYDWMGSFLVSSTGFFRPLQDAGGVVRAFNPLRIDRPFGWLTRDHRKVLVVDGRIGFVSGLCVSQRWLGVRDRAPWRDTGLEIQGPAVADIQAAFAQTWALCGAPLDVGECPSPESLAPAGDTLLRVIASSPYTSGLYRLDQLIAAMAQESLWLTDAYFVGTPAYVQALCAAAQDDVDVRLLVPSTSDIPLVSAFSRAGYRPLLEAGVRIFEWNGPMLHAKSAVADGRWARVGSSNLNVASWISNYELDIAVEDDRFAAEMEAMYLEDMDDATEIVLSPQHRIRPRDRRPRQRRVRPKSGVASAVRLGHTVAAAMQQQRVLGAVEAATLLILGLVLLGLGGLWIYWPQLLAYPVAGVSLWLAVAILLQAWKLWQRHPPDRS
ncbi:MAG: phospholipase D/Transphosphatidylase [Moraxellaceae bacterium]|jgi:cardiolipin synthase|nr:phospholipase D/Transphosphatidylase [Moraxellaceae bacterium]